MKNYLINISLFTSSFIFTFLFSLLVKLNYEEWSINGWIGYVFISLIIFLLSIICKEEIRREIDFYQ